MESDRGIISGFTGVAIHMTIQHILQHMHIANRCNRCKKELAVLKELVMSIELTILHIQQNRLVFKTEKVKEDEASAVNGWLNTLDDLLLKASKIVQHCSIPESGAIFFGFQLRKKICDLNKVIRDHLALSPLLVRVPEVQVGETQKVRVPRLRRSLSPLLVRVPEVQVRETQKVLEGLGQTKDRVEALASSATTAETARKNLMVSDTQKVLEGLRQTKDRVEALASSATTALSEMGDALDNGTIEKKEPYIVGEIQKVLKGLGQTEDRVQKVLEGLGQTKDRVEALASSATTALSEMGDALDNCTIEKKEPYIDVGEIQKVLKGLGQTKDRVQKVLEGLGQTKDRVKALASSATTALSEMGDALDNCTIEKKEPYIVGEIQKVLEGLGQTKGRVKALASSARTALSEMGDALDNCTIENKEPYIVGQCQAFEELQKLLIADVKPKNIGVFGNRGSGKTLLLKTVFKSQEVRTHFSEGLILWLTASQNFSFSSPVNKLSLCKQIAIQKKNLDLIKDIKKEDTQKEWLNQQLQESSGFVLFLDDVCEKNATRLLEELGIPSQHSNSIVIASYRDPNALSESGIADGDSIKILPLDRDHSWELFKHHAFPYDEGNVPSNKDVENLAKLVCEKCGGFPLAIKVVGRAMAGSTHPQQWEWAHSLLKATQDTTENSGQPLNACLRLSLDALGNKDFNLHLCFLYIAASFPEDAIIDAQEVIPLWIGEGLLARKVLEHVPQHKVLADCRLIEPMIRNTEGRPVCLRMQDPFELGRIYLDVLAERCLIEPTARDACGRVLCFRMLKVVHDWAILIAKEEENFYHCVDNGLEVLKNDGSSKIKRIFLSGNKLSSFPQFSSPSASVCSLLISQNKELKIISQKMFRSMLSLKVLDLSGTSAASLPEGVGCLKQLRCLKLSSMPIKRLPKSLTSLGYLEILDVSFTLIEELPSGIHLLRSLRYLSLRGCTKLQYLPCNISGLLSLQYLYLDGCNKLTETPSSRCKKVASLDSLFDLIQLKKFALQNNSKQTIREGTLRSMTELDTLLLALPEMESLPDDINNLSKLRSLSLKCSKLVDLAPFIFSGLTESEIKKKNDVTNLKHLTYLKFYECCKLKDFQHLHKLQNLRQLEIILCPEVRKFPDEFGGRDAFPSLKIFSLVGLQHLEELPGIEGGAMPSLEEFNIMNCPQLKSLPDTYLNNSRFRIRVYGCPKVNVAANTNLVQVVSMSTGAKEIITKYLQALQKKENSLYGEFWEENWLYGEFWCNELFLFVEGLVTFA